MESVDDEGTNSMEQSSKQDGTGKCVSNHCLFGRHDKCWFGKNCDCECHKKVEDKKNG